MGRYVEKEIAIPEGAKEDSLVSFFRGPAQTLELYTARMGSKGDREDARRFLWKEEQWQEEGWIEVLNGEDTQGNVSEDTIRALNTELLGGKGADVLILDGLPVESYQEKGILLDIQKKDQELAKLEALIAAVGRRCTAEFG